MSNNIEAYTQVWLKHGTNLLNRAL